jgi:hypothetical protein
MQRLVEFLQSESLQLANTNHFGKLIRGIPATFAGVTLYPFQICQILQAANVIFELLLKLNYRKRKSIAKIFSATTLTYLDFSKRFWRLLTSIIKLNSLIIINSS